MNSNRINTNTPPISITILLVVALVVFYFSMSAPWLGDDTMYSFKLTDDFVSFQSPGTPALTYTDVEQVDNVSKIIESQNVHYLTVNGRYSSHFLVQLFCGILGQSCFSVCNAIIYVLFLCALLKLCGKTLADTKALLLSCILIFISYITKFVPSTQIGYIWTSFLTVYFFGLLFGKERNIWLTIPLSLLGVFTANGNEAFSIGFSAGLLIYLIRNFRHLSVQKWFMIAGYGIGTILIIVSPGSWHRVEALGESSFVYLLASLVLHIPCIYVLIIYIGRSHFTKSINLKKCFSSYYLYFTSIIISITFCWIAESLDFRSLSGANLSATIIILSLINEKSIKKFWLIMGSFTVALLWLSQALFGWKQINKVLEVEKQYASSIDGRAYVDVWPNTPLLAQITYTPHLSYHTYSDIFNSPPLYELQLRTKYQTDKHLQLYPEFLKGKDNAALDSQIQTIHSGVYLVIVQDGDERKVKVDRAFDFGLFNLPYDTFEPSLGETIMEGPNWKAYIVYDDMFLVSNMKAYFGED